MAAYADRPLLSERFEEALAFAARLHARQLRKGSGVPYVSHLLAVAATVLEHGGDEDLAIAALLHDALEDQGEAFGGAGVLADEIERRFGERVRRVVEGCSDWSGEGARPAWLDRKRRYVAQVPHEPPEVRFVSAADKLHNARSLARDRVRLGPRMWERFTPTPSQALWYYEALLAAYRRAGGVPAGLLQELGEAVEALSSLVAEDEGRQAASRPAPPPG